MRLNLEFKAVKNSHLIGLFLFLCAMTLGISCSPVAPPKTQEELLAGTVSKTWIMTSMIDSDGNDVTSFYGSIKFQFNKDGSFIYSATLAGMTTMARTVDRWKLDGNQLTFAIPDPPNPGAITVTVYELTEKSLRFGIPNNAFNKFKMDFKAE